MKSIFIILIAITVSNLCNAQAPTNVPATESSAMTASLTGSEVQNSSFEHSQSAIAQLRKHISKNIKYPDVMFEYGIEGMVVVEVSISDNGKIHQSRIVKSLSSAFDAAVLKSMETIKEIDMKENRYEGAQKVHVPIKFSITN